jgi:hypothetical protein
VTLTEASKLRLAGASVICTPTLEALAELYIGELGFAALSSVVVALVAVVFELDPQAARPHIRHMGRKRFVTDLSLYKRHQT